MSYQRLLTGVSIFTTFTLFVVFSHIEDKRIIIYIPTDIGNNMKPISFDKHNMVNTSTNIVNSQQTKGIITTTTAVNPKTTRPMQLATLAKRLTTQAAKLTQDTPPKIYIRSNGRLGNQLFQFAAIWGMGRKSNHIPVLVTGFTLSDTFPYIKASVENFINHGQVPVLPEMRGFGFFHPGIIPIYPIDYEVIRYLQSWKYFEGYEQEIRDQLKFKEDIQTRANAFMDQTAKNLALSGTSAIKGLTYVGVHVRRGDYVKDIYNMGYNVAPVSYLENAMNYFKKKYNPVLFIASGDDPLWLIDNLKRPDVMFTELLDERVDFAVLSSCNHTVLTVGTFGWWAGWLAGGEVVYFSKHAKPGSIFELQFNKTDYFPPRWIPME